MSKNQILINTYNADEALRASSFTLMPINPKAPIINSHPIRNIVQTTYTEFGENVTDPRAQSTGLLPLTPTFNTFTIRKGTAIDWTMMVTDPSNINNPSSDENVTYVWKRDGIPLNNLNRQNNNKGTRQVSFSEAEVTSEINGEYICEVSNEYGTTITVPFILDIVDLDNNSIFYSNLVTNGSGEGGLDGWTDSDGAFRVQVINNTVGSTAESSISEYRVSTGSMNPPTYPFTFNIPTPVSMFYTVYYKLKKNNPDIFDLSTNLITDANGTPQGVADWEWWYHTALPSSIIPNEDLEVPRSPQGFYPGPSWIDRYNGNDVVARATSSYKTLLDEMDPSLGPITYFTRNPIEFGANKPVKLSQTINILSAAPMIDNTVAGVSSIQGQFFAYVGLGISRYTIEYTKKKKRHTVNWYVKDLITYRDYLQGATSVGLAKIKPDDGTPINIIPHADDVVDINIEYLDSLGNVIGLANQVVTPTVRDIWAAKEKTTFPLTLYPIFVFFEPNHNPIQVFNTNYTHTDALLPLMLNNIESSVLGAQIQILEDEKDSVTTKISQLDNYFTIVNGYFSEIAKYELRLQQANLGLTNVGGSEKDGNWSQKELEEAEEQIAYYNGLLDQPTSEGSSLTNRTAYEPRKIQLQERKDRKAAIEDEIAFKQANEGIFAGKSAMHPDNVQNVTPFESGLDRNVAFLLRRYGSSWVKNGKIYPDSIWEPIVSGDVTFYEDLLKNTQGNKYRALFDTGASAFFAVQSTERVPAGAKLARINVQTANNNVSVLLDDNAKNKGWDKDTIYNTLYNVDSVDPVTSTPTPTSDPLHEYGNPRCGITQMKFQLIPLPNDNSTKPKHITYELPPESNTVIGMSKQFMTSPGIYTAQPGLFNYTLIQPQLPQKAPVTVENREQQQVKEKEYSAGVEGIQLVQSKPADRVNK